MAASCRVVPACRGFVRACEFLGAIPPRFSHYFTETRPCQDPVNATLYLSTHHFRGDTMKATQNLHELGQSLWLDNITRDLLTKGALTHYVEDLSVTGLTS